MFSDFWSVCCRDALIGLFLQESGEQQVDIQTRRWMSWFWQQIQIKATKLFLLSFQSTKLRQSPAFKFNFHQKNPNN